MNPVYSLGIKVLSGAALLGSVFALVWLGKVEAQVYVGLVSAALAGLGITATKGPST